MANGAMAHALDFEDTHDATLVHPHAAAVPAALALAELLGGVSGPDLITAVATGADLACRLALGFVEPPQGHGYYLIPMLGMYAASAACGKLLRLNEDELIEAFALASCQAICSDELVTYPPSHLRAIRDAFTAKAGILGALLARQGVKAFDRPFEARGGLLACTAAAGSTSGACLQISATSMRERGSATSPGRRAAERMHISKQRSRLRASRTFM